MKKFFTVIFMIVVALTVNAQGQTLQTQEDEDSTVAVIGFFCKNDTMVYHRVQGRDKIIGNDTTNVFEVAEDFMIVVTDSTSKGYKMEIIPISCNVKGQENGYEGRMASLLWEDMKNLRCRFTTDEMGTVQHIENWREIRDVLKKSYTKVFDNLYAELPALDTIMPRNQFENLLLLGCSTEDGIKDQYDELEKLFGLHGMELPMRPIESDDVSEAGFPTHSIVDAFYSKQEDEFDIEGDYVVQSHSETTIPADDVKELMSPAMGTLFTGEVADSISKYAIEFLKESKESMKVNEVEQYCYFYNGWPKLMQTIKVVNVGNIFKRMEFDSIEWTRRHWGEFTFPEEEEPSKNI